MPGKRPSFDRSPAVSSCRKAVEPIAWALFRTLSNEDLQNDHRIKTGIVAGAGMTTTEATVASDSPKLQDLEAFKQEHADLAPPRGLKPFRIEVRSTAGSSCVRRALSPASRTLSAAEVFCPARVLRRTPAML